MEVPIKIPSCIKHCQCGKTQLVKYSMYQKKRREIAHKVFPPPQVFVSAVNAVHTLTVTPDHVKNYRPKILLMTGNPAHRPGKGAGGGGGGGRVETSTSLKATRFAGVKKVCNE